MSTLPTLQPSVNPFKKFWNDHWMWVISTLLGLGLFGGIAHHVISDLDERIDKRVTKNLSDSGLSKMPENLARMQADVENIKSAVTPLPSQINHLTEQVGELEGRYSNVKIGLNQQQKRQANLDARVSTQELLSAPADQAIAALKSAVQNAQKSGERLPEYKLAAYRQIARTDPRTPEEFWATIALMVNYESFLNQIAERAPDPAKVSRTCIGLTEGTGGNNLYVGPVRVSDCVVDLDSIGNFFSNVTFKDPVIRYHGGPVNIGRVTFINCRFVLASNPTTPIKPTDDKQIRFLFALLDSGNRSTFTFSTGG